MKPVDIHGIAVELADHSALTSDRVMDDTADRVLDTLGLAAPASQQAGDNYLDTATLDQLRYDESRQADWDAANEADRFE